MTLDAGRLSRGELIAGISGVALFIFMFFSWFGVAGAGEVLDQAADLGIVIDLDTSANAWQAFDFIDLVLLLTVIVSVGVADVWWSTLPPDRPPKCLSDW